MFLRPTCPDEVFKTIFMLKNTNSVGPDELSTKILKISADIIALVMSHLINLSFEHGIFPNKLKFYMIKPLHKQGDKTLMNKYRPMALLPVISKIFEKIFKKRLISFLDKFSIIRDEQFGFQTNKSTTLAIYNLVKDISQLIDIRKPAVVMFFDMTKAFDHVDHKTLLEKCNCYGIRGTALDWIKSYLENRQQFVRIDSLVNDEMMSFDSSTRVNTFGVPQGSVLGPILFLLYINDLPEISQYRSILFADDISILISSNKEGLENEINLTIESVVEWLESNNLQVNLDKTTYVQFQNYNNKKMGLTVKHKNKTIKESDTVKFLGVTIDRNCNWKSHIENVCNKLNRFVYVLYRLSRITGQKAALAAYHGYVLSVLRYGLLIWGNSTDFNKAFIVQKKCLRAIYGKKQTDSCKPLFKKSKIMTLVSMYILEAAIHVKSNPNLYKKAGNIVNFDIRNKERLVLPKHNSALYSKNCHIMTIKVYNCIPHEIKQLPLKLFKHKLKYWLTENVFYSINDFFNYKRMNYKLNYEIANEF
ncbi:hypothetical protein JYU34_006904 [Plutella xylostella]|uniref:Reverse transcriptase domain-containing protein n=1 Tax=Plutella xylostella TaxID=51655 RepID=A0ABQ7QT66_PLUXY|nr:hypothetical protein JYU34_006904 [Plutella xylostella]